MARSNRGTRSFEELQADLVRRAGATEPGGRGTIVVVPSITFPSVELRKIIGIQYYEERLLYLLLFLRNPGLRVVYVTSLEVNPDIVDYYLSFLEDPEGARRRLTMVSVGNREPSALSSKLLSSPRVMEQIVSSVADPDDAYILPFNMTPLERALVERLQMPVLGPHPDLVSLGSKSGSRRTARAAGVPVLEGSEDLFSIEAVEVALRRLRDGPSGARSAVIKLNNGFSGQGNAIVDLHELRNQLEETPTGFCASEESWSSFGAKVEEEGAIVEELLRELGSSPSVQLQIAPGGSIEVLSTHDQILGGPDAQVYLGCRFPAHPAYRRGILDLSLETAKALAAEGVIGAFGIDFVVGPDDKIYLSEINLRVGGTTHPFGMARFVTGGSYDFDTGELVVDGRAKSYVATDNLKSEDYIGLTPAQVIEAVRSSDLGFDRGGATGVTLHLLGALPEHGKLGATCIADSLDDAERLHGELVAVLEGLRPR
jgi:hypothetical protein